MNKSIFCLLIAVALFVSFGLTSKSAADTHQSASVNQIITPTPKLSAEIQFVNLNREVVIIPCEPPKPDVKREGSVCDDDGLIEIETTANNPQKSEITYYYTISDGQIIGQGKNVIWDLKGVREGTYTITVEIGDNNKVFDKTINKTIQVIECGCCMMPCVCPSLGVTGGGIVKAGEILNFTANVSGGTQTELNYNWTVSQGKIIEGQGTSEIKVKTTPEMTGTVTATVEIGGVLCESCPRTASETGAVEK